MASDCRARRRNFAGGWRLKQLARDCLLTTQSETREYLRPCTSRNQQFGRFSSISADVSCKLTTRDWRPTDQVQEISILLDCFRIARHPPEIGVKTPMGDSKFPATGLLASSKCLRPSHPARAAPAFLVCLAWTAITCDCLRRPAGTGIAVYFETRAARWALVPNSSAQKSQW